MPFRETEPSEPSDFLVQRDLMIEHLRNSPFVTEDRGVFKVTNEAYLPLREFVGHFSGGGYDVPSEYPRTELFLIALLGDPKTFTSFIEAARKPECRTEVSRTFRNSNLFQAFKESENPLIRHDMGRGLPEGVKPPLAGKKILFVGGGSAGWLLLGRFFSDGAVAVNVDLNADTSGFHPPDWSGADVDRREEYNFASAKNLDKTFGQFDAIVIQNVFDYGAVDSAPLAKKILEGLSTNLAKDGMIILQTDGIDRNCQKAIQASMSSQRLAPTIKIETNEGQRGECQVYIRE
jgi:hypothetical protein